MAPPRPRPQLEVSLGPPHLCVRGAQCGQRTSILVLRATLISVQAVVSAVALPLACRYLERVWGARELVRFCCVTIVGSNIIAFGFSWIVWFVLGSEDALYGLPYHGMTGLQVGFLVAFTQLIPEHQVQLLGKIKLRVKVGISSVLAFTV